MSQLGLILRETRETRTMLSGLLTEQMDVVERGTPPPPPRRRTLKERLRLGCCGATWVFRHEQQQVQLRVQDPEPAEVECVSGGTGMNLAAALAAERQLREPPWIMEEKDEEGNDWVCCVCMGRKKGAAFIPCGHTFCRVCSRELWLNRGTCPLCNRSILEILDIF